jgi:Holliday junction resolvase-like predicted endonuclease
MPSTRQIQGTRFESEVAQWLRLRGYKILATGLRVPVRAGAHRAREWVEVDLLCSDPQESSKLWLVEAKNHCNAASSQVSLISRHQHLRLMRALKSLRLSHPQCQVFWALAWRNPQGGVEFTPNPCYF